MKKIFVCLFLSLAFAGCDKAEQNEDMVEQPNRDGAIETILSVTHADSVDILTTTHKIWVKGALAKTLIKSDTLNSLGMMQEEAEDKDGHAQTKSVRKDYEFFITVK